MSDDAPKAAGVRDVQASLAERAPAAAARPGTPTSGAALPAPSEDAAIDALPRLRGYFAIGAERISKSRNLGNLMRSAHGFGASFTFTIGAQYRALEAQADTSKGVQHLPHFDYADLAALKLPKGCRLIGIELLEDAIALPSFHHPMQAAYVLGPERGSLSPELIARCDFTIKIPTRFCVNVAMAGAIVMYDRVKSLARFADRPVSPGGPSTGAAPALRNRPTGEKGKL
ncbi:MAG: RNA methyltransferase [Pseudomonadota bacterium]